MKRIVCLLVIGMLMLGLNSVFPQDEDKKEKIEPIHIGGLFALSGNAMHIGVPSKNVADMVVDHINKKGGINGRQIKLFIGGTQMLKKIK